MNKQKRDIPTEEKIKNTARKLFMQKGFAATRTRDIAEEAGLNLALLNYYYRSKESLFNIIIEESMGQFFNELNRSFNDQETTLEEKMQKLSESYISMLLKNPDLPLFILNEISNPESRFFERINKKIDPLRSRFMEQINESMEDGKMTPVNKLHVMSNFMGLMIFPFVSAPILKGVLGVNDKEFNALMEERKDLIPGWMNIMFQMK